MNNICSRGHEIIPGCVCTTCERIDTPRTTNASFYSGNYNEGEEVVSARFARDLELELAKAIEFQQLLYKRIVEMNK